MGTLDRAGYKYTSEKGMLCIMKNNVLKLTGKLRDGLYVLQGETLIGETNVVSELASKETILWHNRLGHI